MASEQDEAGEFEQNVPEDIPNKEETRQMKSTKFSGYHAFYKSVAVSTINPML